MIASAWQMLNVSPESFKRVNPDVRHQYDVISDAYASTVGPLLTTTWGQGNTNNLLSPYNEYTPAESGCTHTLTDCLATAMAQVMKYWNWPASGAGSASYTWTYNSATLSTNFAAHTYDWANMPAALSASTTATQNNAIAQLIYDAGISTRTQYGCTLSTESYYLTATSLPLFFNYRSVEWMPDRYFYTSSTDWMGLIMAELNASPTPRPVLLVIQTADGANHHKVVIDGYQNIGGTEEVHVNYGQSMGSDGYYDITNNWTTTPQSGPSSYTWSSSMQNLIVGIEPDNVGATFTLTEIVTGSGSGAVSVLPAAKWIPTSSGSGSQNFADGTQVILYATPASGSVFAGWGGACSGNGIECTIAMNSDESVTATFQQNTSAATYSISGTATSSSGAAMPGVTMNLLSGANTDTGGGALLQTATTDSNGNYSFSGISSGAYVVMPNYSGYSFSPLGVFLPVNNTNVTGQNFVGTSGASSYTITASAGTGGIISPSGTIAVNYGGSQTFTITPSAGYLISSVLVNHISVGAVSSYTFRDSSGSPSISANFIANSGEITSGTLSTSGGTAISGATMTVSGSGIEWTTTTNSNGSYSFTGLPSGSYIITPSLTGYTFNPASLPLSVSSANVTGENFTATQSASACPGSPAMMSGANPTYFSSLQSAYNGASNGSTIGTQWITFGESPVFNRNISLDLIGGYDCYYVGNSSYSTVTGRLTISNGTVTVSNLIIQ
jgi:hypothetical protein